MDSERFTRIQGELERMQPLEGRRQDVVVDSREGVLPNFVTGHATCSCSSQDRQDCVLLLSELLLFIGMSA